MWRSKLSLKTLLAMANRDEAKALKDRKPIDYHMFLTSKFKNNTFFQYNDYIDKKFTAHTKLIESDPPDEHNSRENRVGFSARSLW